MLPLCIDEPDPAVVRTVAARHAPGLPVYLDPSSTSRLSYDVQTLPLTILISPDGHLLGRVQGALHWSAPEMDTLIRACLGAENLGAL